MKNIASKSRPAHTPYAIWTDPRTGWAYRLLKSWQGDNSDIYARWLVDVEGWGHDIGDTYVIEMKVGLITARDLVFDTALWPDRTAFLKWAKGDK